MSQVEVSVFQQSLSRLVESLNNQEVQQYEVEENIVRLLVQDCQHQNIIPFFIGLPTPERSLESILYQLKHNTTLTFEQSMLRMWVYLSQHRTYNLKQWGLFLAEYTLNNAALFNQVIQESRSSQPLCLTFLTEMHCLFKHHAIQGHKVMTKFNQECVTQILKMILNLLHNCDRIGTKQILAESLQILMVLLITEPHDHSEPIIEASFNGFKCLWKSVAGKNSNYRQAFGSTFRLFTVLLNITSAHHQSLKLAEIHLQLMAMEATLNLSHYIRVQLSLKDQAQKIAQMDANENTWQLQLLRGIAVYVEAVICYHLKSNSMSKARQYYPFHQRLLQVRDFLVFGACCRAWTLILLSDADFGKKTLAIGFQVLIGNCLPGHFESESSQIEQTNLHILDQSLERVSQLTECSLQYLFGELLSEMIRLRQLDNAVLEKIMDKIELQFDKEFDYDEFANACNCFSWTLKVFIRATKLDNTKAEMRNFIKMLLNLNESCVAENRWVVNQKVFEMMVVCPQVLLNNAYLQEVIENQLIDRYPKTKRYIDPILEFEFSHVPEKAKLSQRLVEKLLNKALSKELSVQHKAHLWKLLFQAHQLSANNLSELKEICLGREDQVIAKNYAAKKLGKDWGAPIKILVEIKERYSKHEAHYHPQIQLINYILGQ